MLALAYAKLQRSKESIFSPIAQTEFNDNGTHMVGDPARVLRDSNRLSRGRCLPVSR